MKRSSGPYGIVALALALALGCDAEDPTSGNGPRNPGTAGIDAAAGSGGTAGTGFVGTAGTGTVGTAGTGDPAIDPNACGGTVVEPKTIEVEVKVEVTEAEPVAIYIMLDNSGSMLTLWPGAVSAITEFVNDPKSAGLDVAFGIFPGFAAACDSTVYETPSVALGRLPAHAPNIIAGMPAFPAGSGTNIEPALRGATEFCKKFTPADPKDADEKCIVLFITDGDPSTCQLDRPTLAKIAGDAFTSAGIKTFSIALQGADVTFLDQIATLGGGDCDPAAALNTCDLTTGASFSKALTAIRDTVTTIETRIETQKQALECEWGLPDPKPGQTFDKELVNVSFKASPTATATIFKNVPDAASCAGNTQAWHYDDASQPTRILACPATCDALKAATDGRIDVVLGCPIVVVE